MRQRKPGPFGFAGVAAALAAVAGPVDAARAQARPPVPAPAPAPSTPTAPTPTPTPVRADSAQPPRPPRLLPGVAATGKVLALTRKEAIVRAITQSPDLAVSRIDADVALAAIDQARGEFEPFGFLGGNYASNRDPSFQREIAPGVTFSGLPPGLVVNPSTVWGWNGGARMRTELGTSFELRYEMQRRETANVFALNPAYTPAFVAQVTQPVLRGLGMAVNRSFITVSMLRHDAQLDAYQDAALALALSVEDAYWGFGLAQEQENVAEQALVTARELLKNVRERRAAGTVADIEVFSGEAGVASREEQLIRARNSVLNAQDQLLRLIVPPRALSEWDVSVVLLDEPRLDDDEVDVMGAIEMAFQRRPDVHAIAVQQDIEAVQIARAENDALPTLNVIGSWTQLGLGDGHHDSHEALLGGRFYDWTIGVQFEYPLFNIGPRGAIREAEARKRRAIRQRDVLEQNIVLEVRAAAREIATGRERVRAAEYSVELARKQLQASQDRLDNGLATSFDVLLQEEALTSARVLEINARIDFMRARARLERAKGTLLDSYEIEVR